MHYACAYFRAKLSFAGMLLRGSYELFQGSSTPTWPHGWPVLVSTPIQAAGSLAEGSQSPELGLKDEEITQRRKEGKQLERI